MINRYVVFGGESHYASGGGYDYLDCVADLNHAIEVANGLLGKEMIREQDGSVIDTPQIDWVQVFDMELKQILYTVGEPHGACAMITDYATK